MHRLKWVVDAFLDIFGVNGEQWISHPRLMPTLPVWGSNPKIFEWLKVFDELSQLIVLKEIWRDTATGAQPLWPKWLGQGNWLWVELSFLTVQMGVTKIFPLPDVPWFGWQRDCKPWLSSMLPSWPCSTTYWLAWMGHITTYRVTLKSYHLRPAKQPNEVIYIILIWA